MEAKAGTGSEEERNYLFWHMSLLLCFLIHRDDLKTFLHLSQGYSRPSMCFSACSFALLIRLDLKSHLVQDHMSRLFWIMDSIVAIVSGSTIDAVCIFRGSMKDCTTFTMANDLSLMPLLSQHLFFANDQNNLLASPPQFSPLFLWNLQSTPGALVHQQF